MCRQHTQSPGVHCTAASLQIALVRRDTFFLRRGVQRSNSLRALQGCVAANSPGAMRHIFPETRRASLKVLACIAGLQIALVRRSASRASLRHACNESSLDWRGGEHRPKRVYTRAHGHTDKRGKENNDPLAVNERAWKTVCMHRASEGGPLVSGRCYMRPIRAQIERSHGSNPSARSEPSTNGSTAQKGYSCNM